MSKGIRPAISSNIMTPSAQTSLRGSASRAPCTCSGAMYAGVPIIIPTSVARRSGARTLEMPKSRSFGVGPCGGFPFARKTFSGLMSR